MTRTFLGGAIACILLLSGFAASSNAQAHVFPIPRFESGPQNAQADALRDAMGKMREHLCFKPKYERLIPNWQRRYSELFREMSVAEHAIIWAASGNATNSEYNEIARFDLARENLFNLLDRLAKKNPALDAPAERLREGENRFSIAARNASLGNAVFTVYGMRARLYDVDKDIRPIITQLPESDEYSRLMSGALKILGDAEAAIYLRGINEIRRRAPVGASFAFSLHRTPDELSSSVAAGVAQKFVDLTGITGVDADGLMEFDAAYPWHGFALHTRTFDEQRQEELSGGRDGCPMPTVRLIYHYLRKGEADIAGARLFEHNFTVAPEERRGPDNPENKRRVYYHGNANLRGAQFIADLLKEVEVLTPQDGGRSTGAVPANYTVWILAKPEPKKNTIRVSYTQERSEDARRAIHLLENHGYTVVPQVVDYNEFKDKRLQQMQVHLKRGATMPEARAIADLVKPFEEVSLRDDNVDLSSWVVPYELWIIKKKEEGTATINWFHSAEKLIGKHGERFTFVCRPYAGVRGTPWGTDSYSADSAICSAAVHAGVITFVGGKVTIEMRPGEKAYRKSTRHGITSGYWEAYPGSFVFVTN